MRAARSKEIQDTLFRMRPIFCLLVASVVLSACASTKTAGRVGKQGAGGAVMQPLEDFNLVRDKVPAILRRAENEGPYTLPRNADCRYLHTEVAALDEVLGPDMDVEDPAPSGRMEQGGAMVGRQAVAAMRDLTTDWIPMRNWVRRLTGAEYHSSKVQKAVNAGVARRAYLKGVARAEDCPIVAQAPPTQFPAPPQTPSSVDGPASR